MDKIPKVIHLIWFGDKEKSDLNIRCIKSWKKYLPDYNIKIWNLNNFNYNKNAYTKRAYEEKNWAFLSDYVRLYILYT